MNKEKKRKFIFAQLNSLPNAFQYVEVTNYIKELEQENKELHNKIDKAIEITHKILMNNADNRMICSKEEEEYFDWLDKEMLEQEKILKDSDVHE